MSTNPKKLLAAKDSISRSIHEHGDAAFLLALFLVIGLAMLLFYRYLYPSIFSPPDPPVHEPIFNKQLYTKVLGTIDGRDVEVQHELEQIQRNPFE